MEPNQPTATHWWWPRSPMQRRFAATFVASVVAPMAIMATVLVWLVHSDARRNVHEHLAALADQKQVQLEQHFDLLRRNASALARQKMIRRFLRHSADGTPDPRFAPPVFDLLHGYQEAHWGLFHHVMLALPNGNVVLSPPHGSATHAHESQDLSALPEFVSATAGPIATGFFGFEETDHYHQLYLQPVKSGDECLGVLVFEIEIDHIRQMLGGGFDPDSGTWASLLTLDGTEVVKLKTERKPALRFDLLQRATEAPGLYVGEYDGHSGRPVLGACYRAGEWPWVLALELDRARAFEHANDLKGISSVLGGLCALLILFIGLRMASQYARPLITIASEAEALATGDLTSPITITGHGEVRDAHAALEHVRTSWRTVAAGIRDRATDLASAARQLHSTASELKTGVESTTQRTYTISAASEQMSTTMSNVSDSGSGVARRTSDCMTTVADMERGMVELENRAAAANAVAERMAAFASQNSTRITELDTATNEVSKVTDLIRDIAEQTNLLALNATIEAARAGESGRGFAVVANEVKNLALQTAQASGEIIEQVQDIKTSTGAAVEVIDGVGTVAGEIQSTFQAMEQEIQDQVSAARGVLNLMRQTASEVGQLSNQVFESSATSGEVTRSIGEIVGTARETSEGADNTAAASEHLTRLADELAGLASGFKT